MRAPIPAVVVGLAVAAVGAVILGEYPLVGVRALLAGLVFGVTVAELMAGVARPGPDELYLPFAESLFEFASTVPRLLEFLLELALPLLLLGAQPIELAQP